MNLNGFDIEEAKILRLSGKPQNAPEGMIQGLRELTQLERSGQGSRHRLLLGAPVHAGVSLLRAPEVEGLHDSYSEFIYKSQNHCQVLTSTPGGKPS